MNGEASTEIVEEPASLMRSGTLFGVNTTADMRTYPAIKIVNYTGDATVLVSSVTRGRPYRTHPHDLVGQNCARGVCYIGNFTTNSENPPVLRFPDIRIQCAKMNEIEARLADRQILRIDPFGNGFEHIQDVRRSLNSVRLCFQVTIRPDRMNPTQRVQLTAKVTEPIFIYKLVVSNISDRSSPKCGGKRIMILCNRISQEHIRVRFFRKRGDNIIWQDWGTRLNIHHNVGISFTTPRYTHQDQDRDTNIVVNLYVQLVRPSDNSLSKPISFQYIPDITEITYIMIKRKKLKIKESHEQFEYLCENPNLKMLSTPAQHQKVLPQPVQHQQVLPQPTSATRTSATITNAL